jgi:PAS domain S-box-containing protein
MSNELQFFRALLASSLVVSLVFIAYALRRRDRRGAGSLAVLFTGASLWILADLIQLLTPENPAPVIGTRIRIVGPDVLCIGAVLFALEYTGREQWIDRRLLGLLALKPLLSLVVILTPAWDALFEFGPSGAGTPGYDVVITPFYAFHVTYDWLLVLAAFALLGYTLVRARYDRRQLFAILVAFLVPGFVNILFYLDFVSYNPTTLGLFATAAVLTYGVFELWLLDPLPIARRAVLEEMSDLVILVDERGLIGMVNEATEEAFGSERDLVGRHVSAVLGADISLDDEEESLTVTTTVDGNRRQFRVNRSPLTDYRGTVLGQLLVCRDVTERRQRQRRLKRQNDRLDQFASMVSHDLRNPLTIAQGRAELAEQTGDDEHFEALHDAHERMESMIGDLLTMARAESAIEETEQTELRALVESAWETARTGGADVEVSVPPERTLECDPDLLLNVFENLFRNAVEHGPTSPDSHTRQDAVEHGPTSPDSHTRQDAAEHGPTSSRTESDDAVDHDDPPLTVQVGTLSGGGDQLEGFYVADDGEGIPEGERENIFEHGYTTNSDGTGFGLAIVRDIVQAHGWELTVTDSSDGGARFEIELKR